MEFNRRSGRRPNTHINPSSTTLSYIPVPVKNTPLVTNTSTDSFVRDQSPGPGRHLATDNKENEQSQPHNSPLKSPPHNAPSKSKVYTDKHVVTKPPIPTSHICMYHRPPTRLSSRNDWESGPSSYKESRPASPLTRTNLSADATDLFISRKLFKLRPENGSCSTISSSYSTPKFKYCGPHQTYPAYEQLLKSQKHNQGEGPEEVPQLSDLSLPKSEMDELTGKPKRSRSPHLIPNSTAFHERLCQAISGFPFNYSQTYQERSYQPKNAESVPVPCLNNQHKTEPCLFQAFLEQNHNYLLRPTDSATNLRRELFSSLPPSLTTPTQKPTENNNMSTTGFDRTATPPWSPQGPKSEKDIYEEREILRETVKAMKTMSDQGPFLSTGIPNEIQDDLLRIELLIELRKYKRALSSQLQAHEHMIQLCSSGCVPSPPHSLLHDIGKFPVRPPQMDPLKIFGEETSSKRSRSKSGEKRETMWEKDLAKHLNSTDFMAAFSNMKPPVVRLSDPKGNDGGHHGVYTVNPVMIDLQGNNPQSISLLKEAKTEDFPMSTSVFPSGMMSIINQSQILSPTPYSKSEAGAASNKENETTTGQSLPGTFQQQYKQFMLEKNEYLDKVKQSDDYHYESKSGDSNNVLDSGQLIMLRKPVAISKARNTSGGYAVSNPNSTSTTASGEDRPSPFFPGVSGDRIDMKIRSAEERLQNHHKVSPAQVEELGNLLSQLPVLSRKQKAEEFAFQTLKPPSPVVEADSETSMLPLVSSHGTMTSNIMTSGDERPPTRDLTKSGVSVQSPVNTDKMSLHELISLGHKIYGILSQLNTATSKKNLASSSSTGGHLGSDPNNSIKGQSKSFTNAIDLQSFPNPTFITGPGVVMARSTPKVGVPSNSKVVQPPPTRWGGRPPPTSNQNLDKVSSNRHTRVRSTSSIGSVSRPNSTITRTILNWQAAASRTAGESRSYTVYVPPPASQSTSAEQNRYVRQDTPYPVNKYDVDLVASNTTTATQGARSASKRRNFIRENISKIRNIKKVPPERSRLSQLPPVARKYDNVTSIVKSASRGRSTSVPTDDGNVERRRSSSLPTNNRPSGLKSTNFRGATYTAVSRPVSAQSVTKPPLTVQKSKESLRRPPQSASLPPPPKKKSSTGNTAFKDFKTLLKGKLGIGKTSSNSHSTIKTVESEEKKSIVRKSRSKTKKGTKSFSRNFQPGPVSSASASSQEIIRVSRTKSKHLSRSSLVRVPNGRSNKSGKYNRTGKWNQTGKTNFKQAISNQVNSLPRPQQKDDFEVRTEAEESLDPPGEYLTATESEQALIKLMVKQEMDMMVERHVKDALARAKAEKDMDYRFRPGDSDHENDSVINSENLAPAYTPPRFHDESLFSLEKWINPDGPGTAYTSEKDTPVTTATTDKGTSGNNNRSSTSKGSLKKKTSNKPQTGQTVRFSLPQNKP